MSYILISFIISFCILFFGVISISIAPIINKNIKDSSKWGTLNCIQYSDLYNYYKKNADKKNIFESIEKKEKYLKDLIEGKKLCYKKVSMYNFEYISYISDIIIGFICSLLSFIYYTQKEIEEKENILLKNISILFVISFGVIGFIFTLVYIIYSQYIFNNGSPGKEYENPGDPNSFSVYNSNKIYKLDEERAFAFWSSADLIYDCFYYKENNEDSLYAKYNELGQKQYNYDKDLYINSILGKTIINLCNCNSDTCIPEIECKYHYINIKELRPRYSDNFLCPNLVYNNDEINLEIRNKNIYDRWLTTLVFSYFIMVLYFFLILFGFLLLNLNDNHKIVNNNDNNN